MIDQRFVNRVEELRHHTKSTIDKIQKCCCPMVYDIYLVNQFEYWYDGYKYNIWEDDTQLYAVNQIPYCYDNHLKNVIFKGKLEDLVNEDKVWPFLLFVNGHVVPWSKITIIRDYDYSYMRLDGEDDDYVDSAYIMYFPLRSKDIIYGEDENFTRDPDINGLYFDENGYFLDHPEFKTLSLRLEFKADIYMNIIRTTDVSNPDTDGKLMIEFSGLEFGKVPTLNNMILFDSNRHFIGSGPMIEGLTDDYNGAYSRFVISPELSESNGYIVQMYFKDHNDSVSYLYHRSDNISSDKIKKIMENPESSEENKIVSKTIFNPFDFDHTRDRTYDSNIRNSMRYITRYDYSLWNKVFVEDSPIKSFTYTGREFKQLADLRSYVRFSRKHSELIEDVVMMFVNSEIYEHGIDISYTNNTINIPAFGIMDDDVVEIVMFTKCNNNILNLVVKDELTPVYINPEYNLNDCYIMDDECGLLSYPDTPISLEGRRQYICDTDNVTVDENNNYTIKFVDNHHYKRTLKLVPKNQFRYYRYTRVEGQHKIVLPQQFNYCHDLDHYMIFVNGKKIDKTEYAITIMNRYRPFDQLILYLTTILDENDRVDIFYLPEYLVEKYKEPKTTLRGSILLKTDYPKMYALSKETSMIFVNGRKINPMDIKDISMNSVAVNTKYNAIDNVTIVEYIDGAKEAARYLYGLDGTSTVMGDTTWRSGIKTLEHICGEILDKNEQVILGTEDMDLSKELYDAWSIMIKDLREHYKSIYTDESLTDNDYQDMAIKNLFDEYPLLDEDTIEPNYKKDYAPLRAILYDIVVDYYIQRAGATTGSVFDYDFEIQEWNEDPAGNKDITLYEAGRDKLFDYDLDTIQGATRDLVTDGKKFYGI